MSVKKSVKKRGKGAVKKELREEERELVENILGHGLMPESRDIFFPPKKITLRLWVKRYSPILITVLIGLATYLYVLFYLFTPSNIVQQYYLFILVFVLLIFFVAGFLIFVGLKSEWLFIRMLSFIFTFALFTFLTLFALLMYSFR
jgi:hypothetical protein